MLKGAGIKQRLKYVQKYMLSIFERRSERDADVVIMALSLLLRAACSIQSLLSDNNRTKRRKGEVERETAAEILDWKNMFKYRVFQKSLHFQ